MELSSLIGAHEWEDFHGAFLRREMIVRAATATSLRFSGLWSDWELDAVCRFTLAPHYEQFRLVTRGKQVARAIFVDRDGAFRREAFGQVRAAGASVALGNFENYSNTALALSRALEAAFRLPVQINLYVTPGGHQGLGAHVDPHDVLVLQIQGEKVWDIYAPRDEASSLGENKQEIVLREGSWLFLPKGVRHEVRNRGSETSVHFTVGFHPLTWGEVFQRALNESRASHPALNERLVVDACWTGTADEMLERIRPVLASVDLAKASAAYYGGFPALMVRVPEADLVAPDAPNSVGEGTVLRWASETSLRRTAGGPLELMQDYRRHPLQLRPDFGEGLEWMRQAAKFVPAEVPLKDPAEGVLLCRFLAGLGMLRVESARR